MQSFCYYSVNSNHLFFFASNKWLTMDWQFHEKAASAFSRIFHADFALMCCNDFFCNTQTRAKVHFISVRLVGTVEAVKNPLFVFFCNAASGIRNNKAQEGFIECKGKLYCSIRGGIGKGVI